MEERIEIVNSYVDDVISFLSGNGFFEEEYITSEVDNIEKFKEIFHNELKLRSFDQFDVIGSPTLLEEDFLEAVHISMVEYSLGSLQELGLIQSKFDTESGQIIYSLNDGISKIDDSGYGMYDH